MNFTDVDDKTIRRSHEQFPELDPMTALRTLTNHYGSLFLDDMRRIGNNTDALTIIKAADDTTIEGMRQLIRELHEQGFAYIADDGVYFSIDAYRKSGKTYGQLVELTEANTSSERIQNDEYDKESVHDFALWKNQKPGEPAWEFELNGHTLNGRPGWHIECSVMSRQGLGQPFDIHTGGIDLAFPHHENEIAQSTAGNDNPSYAHFFIHNEHILVDGRKMSKSLGNFYTLSDITDHGFDPLAFRMLVLQSHYRRQTNFSFDNLQAAENRRRHWRSVSALVWQGIGDSDEDESVKTTQARILAALQNDLDTPEALRIIDEAFSRYDTQSLAHISPASLRQLVEFVDAALGLNIMTTTPNLSSELQALVDRRIDARENKDWNLSDELRVELHSKGVEVRDTADGTIWSYR
jgi:cysteinyl-tRNA synthetase